MRVLHQIQPHASESQIAAEADDIITASTQKVASGRFWTRRLRKPIMLAIFIAFFNQLSGINAILYFAPRISELTRLGAKAALLQSVGIGLTNLIFTLVGLWLIDRLGRRTLLHIGSDTLRPLALWLRPKMDFIGATGLRLRVFCRHDVPTW